MKNIPPIRTFEELDCWKHCRTLRLFVARQVVPALPKHEQYRLADQVLRAARSATANIAEGYGRFHHLENAKFCSIARASCWEVLDHPVTSRDGHLVPEPIVEEGRQLVSSAVMVINGYMRYLKRAKFNPE